MKKKKVIILNIAGLSPYLIENSVNMENTKKLIQESTYRKTTPSFPSVTCSVQASIASGKPAADNGIIGNGFFDKTTLKPKFWEQDNKLVNGPRIWDWMREKDKDSKVAVLFWQNSKYIDADIVITPAPMHTDDGMVEWCYSKPVGLYEELAKKHGSFNLRDYWGPLAGRNGAKGSEWIVKAALDVLENKDPDMLLAYIPHLDYISQRVDPQSKEVFEELKIIDDFIGQFMKIREEYGKDDMVLMIVSEYGMVPVDHAVMPNQILRDAGFLKVRTIAGKEYIDYELSDAFALVDHQIAHVYFNNKDIVEEVKTLFEKDELISRALNKEEQKEFEVSHERSGELILLSEMNSWFAYYYWQDESKAPFFAETVDIHNKPGYDPCELFVDMKTKKITLDHTKVNGSHGLPATTDKQKAVFICSEDIGDYAPEEFTTNHILSVLYRIT